MTTDTTTQEAGRNVNVAVASSEWLDFRRVSRRRSECLFGIIFSPAGVNYLQQHQDDPGVRVGTTVGFALIFALLIGYGVFRFVRYLIRAIRRRE